MSKKQQTMGFQTEVKKMLQLVVHSLYSNKEIFVRELISNASDALDKLRFLALSEGSLYEQDSDLKITVAFDAKQKTITIADNGIGMTWDEAVTNLGTIAKSGTEEFISHLTGDQMKDSNLIGQFGVGFYSAFIVADRVVLKSRRAGAATDTAIQWESKGDGEFTIASAHKESRGTDVVLHLKDDAEEFLSDWRIRGIITKYSDHISWPIVMQEMSKEPDESEEGAEKAEQESPGFETVNKATALWTQQKSEIADEDYKALYKHLSHDYQDPLIWTHNHVEGKHEYISLLYIPSHAPYDLWQHEAKHGLKLYVKRVFIMDDVSQFLPRYLRFVKGIVDASDLPLNVSREILQDNKQVDSIKSACTKRILSALEKMSQDNAETYQKFWKAFGLVLKEGPVEDFANRETIAKLLRFTSTQSHSEEQTTSLADYVSRMQDKQDKIYYITAATYNAAKNSPHLEIFKKKGIEVLLLSDRIDEWLTGHLGEFEGKKLQSIAKGKVDLDDDAGEVKKQEESYAPMLAQIKGILADRVKDVQLTNRLTDSPACIVADEHDMGLEMQRILQAAGQQVPASKPIFEINPDHVLIKRIHGIEDDVKFEQWINVLYEQSLIAEGGQLDNPADFVRRVNNLLIEA